MRVHVSVIIYFKLSLLIVLPQPFRRLHHLRVRYNSSAPHYTTTDVPCSIPSNMLITRVRPSTFLVGVMMLWAVISVCTAFSRNYTGLLLTRFFLGVVEAPYYPGALCKLWR
jgi:MFS family permease